MATAKGQALGLCPDPNSWVDEKSVLDRGTPWLWWFKPDVGRMNQEMPKAWHFPRPGRLRAGQRPLWRRSHTRSSWSEGWMEKTLQELSGPCQGSNPFLRVAALIIGVTARMASLQNIPCRRQLAVLPSDHQLPTLLTGGSKAPTEVTTQVWLRLLARWNSREAANCSTCLNASS